MKIWIFNPFDELPWEGPEQRYATLAATLAAAGHTVVWWSSGFSHRRKVQRSVNPAVAAGLPYDVRLVAAPPYAKNISLRRVWNHWMYGRLLYRDAIAAVAGGDLAAPDVILASLPPMEGPMAALRLRARFGCRVITDVMDAWPETLQLALGGSLFLVLRCGVLPALCLLSSGFCLLDCFFLTRG